MRCAKRGRPGAHLRRGTGDGPDRPRVRVDAHHEAVDDEVIARAPQPVALGGVQAPVHAQAPAQVRRGQRGEAAIGAGPPGHSQSVPRPRPSKRGSMAEKSFPVPPSSSTKRA